MEVKHDMEGAIRPTTCMIALIAGRQAASPAPAPRCAFGIYLGGLRPERPAHGDGAPVVGQRGRLLAGGSVLRDDNYAPALRAPSAP